MQGKMICELKFIVDILWLISFIGVVWTAIEYAMDWASDKVADEYEEYIRDYRLRIDELLRMKEKNYRDAETQT